MGSRIKLPGTTSADTVKARRWRIFWSYLPDWCLTIFLWGIFYLLDKVDGYRRKFSVTDTSLAFPYADPERIKVWHLAIYCGIIPALIIILTGALVRRSPWDVHSGILGLVLSLGLTVTFTDIIKITAGRPRPDLFARCQLPEDLTSNPVHGLIDWTYCTQTDKLQEGFRSFPSGHSSFAWAGMWYLILYSAAKMRIANRRSYTWKSWLLLAPLSCAALVSVSRTMDYRHHATDVIAGAIIGVLASWVAYRQFYPPLSHPQSYKPYSPRIPKDEEIPLHQPSHARSAVTHNRPSVDDHPHSALLPSRPSAPLAPASQNGTHAYGYGAYPPQSGYDTAMGPKKSYDTSLSNGEGRSHNGETVMVHSGEPHGEYNETVQRD